MATKVRVMTGQMDTGTAVTDVIPSGETDTPTGAVILIGNNINLDDVTTHWNVGFGVTDFTTSVGFCSNEENNVNPTDSHTVHQEADALFLTDEGVSSTARSAAVTAIAGGIRITPNQSGSAFRFMAFIIYGSTCKAFSAGAGTASASTFGVNTGMDTPAGAGFYGQTLYNESNGADMELGLGFHAHDGGSIQQAAWGYHAASGIGTNTDNNARVQADRVAVTCTAGGAENEGCELTSNVAGTATFTARGGTLSGDLIGLLVECADCDTAVAIIDSPTDDTVDWDYTGLSFQPQCIAMLANRVDTVATAITDTDAGVMSYIGVDELGTELSFSGNSIDNRVVSTSNSFTRSALHQNIEVHVQGSGGARSHDMTNMTFNSTGWTIAAADIVAGIDTTVRKWPMLAFGPAVATGEVINRVLTENVLITDPIPGSIAKQRRPGDRVELLTDAIFLYTAFGRLLLDNFDVNDAYIIKQNLDKQLIESIGLESFIERVKRVFRNMSDVIAVADSAEATVALGKIMADAIETTDSFIAYQARGHVMPEAISIRDFLKKSVERASNQEIFVTIVEDFISVVDAQFPVVGGILVKKKTDTLAVFENTVLQYFRNRVLTEGIDLFDAARPQRIRKQVDSNDAVTVADQLELVNRRRRLLQNDAVVTDVADRAIVKGRGTSDSIAVSENILVTRSAITNISTLFDSISVTDLIGFIETGTTLPPSVVIEHGIEPQ